MNFKYLFYLVFAILSVNISSMAYAAAPSAYTFEKPSDYTTVKLSPSGTNIIFVKNETNKFCLDGYGRMLEEDKARCKDEHKKHRTKQLIQIYNLKEQKPVTAYPMPENIYVSWIEWASDDRILIGIKTATTIGNRFRYSLGQSRILSLSITDKADRVALFQEQKTLLRKNRHLTRITNLLPDDSDHIIMPANKDGDLDLWKVNVIDGTAERIARGTSQTFFWYTNKAGKPTLRFDCSGRKCRKIFVFAYQDGNDKWEKIKSFKVKPDEDEEHYDFWPIAPIDGTASYYVLSNEDDDERRAVKIFDLEKNAYIKTVYEHPSMDVSGVFLDLKTGDYAGAWYYEDRLQYSLINSELQTHYDALNKFFKFKKNVDLLGFSEDNHYAVVFVSGPNNPGEYYLYEFSKHNVVKLFERKPGLTARLKNQTDILKIPTRDGQTITAYHTYPKGKRNSKTPLLVMPHGGPEARNYYDYNDTEQYFVSHGYQVLTVNFRGSSGYGRKFTEAGYGQWGRLMQDDVTDAVNYLFQKHYASADNTCIVGYSYGGYVALYGAATTPKLYRCAVSGGGVTDLVATLDHDKREYGKDSETYGYVVKSIGNPKTDKATLKARSPVNMADQIQVPVLLIHGKDDGIVSVTQSRKMNSALKRAGKNVSYIEVKDEGHRDWSLENDILYLEKIEAFLQQHLTPG